MPTEPTLWAWLKPPELRVQAKSTGRQPSHHVWLSAIQQGLQWAPQEEGDRRVYFKMWLCFPGCHRRGCPHLYLWQSGHLISVSKALNSHQEHGTGHTIFFFLFFLFFKLIGLRSSCFRRSMPVSMLSHFSRVWLFATLWTIAHQASLSMGFSRQEC